MTKIIHFNFQMRGNIGKIETSIELQNKISDIILKEFVGYDKFSIDKKRFERVIINS